jgi:hypothetical protein
MKYCFSYFALISCIFFESCKMSETSFQVIQAGDINLSPRVKTIAIVDRTLVDKKNRFKNTIEGMVTGENIGQDKQAEQEVVSGLNNILRNSPRIQVKMTSIRMAGSGTGLVFPAPLDTTEINNICRQYKADAVAALETFDSDCSGRLVIIKLGFRLYDGINNSIADQHIYNYRLKWKRSHSMNYRGMTNRFNERTAINQASYQAGEIYGKRIVPTALIVKRKLFTSGDATLAMGSRKAQAGDWKGAAEVWQQVLKNPSLKIAGMAAYNLALSSENAGDLKQAQTWVSQASATYKNKEVMKYGLLINQRLMEKERLEQQMKTE